MNKILKNLQLLPVFVPIILSFSSWTLYRVIHSDQGIIKAAKKPKQDQNIFKINDEFLRSKSDENNISKVTIETDSYAAKNIADDSTSVYHLFTDKIPSEDPLDAELLFRKSFSDGINSKLINSGYIGEIGNKNPERDDPNASDNIFDVQLQDVDLKKNYILKYEVNGYSGLNSVTRSVNGSYAIGGYIKQSKNGWTSVSEIIDPALLKKGNNKILFNALNKGDYYEIKDVHITEDPNKSFAPYTIISKIYNDKIAYVRGFIDDKSGIESLEIQGERIDLKGNEFEYVSHKNLHQSSFSIKFKAGLNIPEMVVEKTKGNSFFTGIAYENKGHNVVYRDESGLVKGLRTIDIPPVDLSIINVSDKYSGFRFYNNSSKNAELHLPYDKKKLVQGYQEKDITAFTFDFTKKEWSPVKIDSVNIVKKYVVLHTSLISADFMVGVVKQPESPETGANAPTSFNAAPIANPASKINLIAPPTANQQGTAVVTYPIEIPAGIGGFKPNVSLIYNSDNKFGWAGTGWDIPVETIDIDTRWGVPSFTDQESEIYLIAGEQLVFKDGYLPNKLPYSEPRTANRQFYYRNGIKEGYIITRKGSSPAGYTWEIVDGSGTKKEYLDKLTQNSTSNSSGNIVKWFLSKVTDRFGNTITYTYSDSFDGGGKNKYLSRITYSNNTVIEFENEAGVRGDMTFNYKLGVKLTDAKILNKITVKRANIKVREYQLNNTTVGLFSKRLLTEIIQNDGNGNLFNKHRLTYDTSVGIFGKTPAKVYTTPKDNGDVGSFSGGNTSFISGTYSKNKNIRGAVSLGGGACFLFGIDKKGTVGITASYDDNRAYGKNQLLDIDGDGLLDKAFYSSNGTINYRKNTKTAFSGVFSSTGLPGETPIYTHNNYNTTIGLEYSFARGVVGANYSFGNSNSPIYFSDVNGDGLLDMINYGEVFFSKIRNGVPQFKSQPATGTTNVTEETPNAILAGHAAVQDTITTTQFSSSLANIVRMWEAPVSGDIHISNGITLTQNSVDGVDVWIEKGGMTKANEDNAGYTPSNSNQISPTVTLNNLGQYQPVSASTYVEKGQRILIVASSKADQVGDRIKVDTDIRYTTVAGGADLDRQDANNNYYFRFNARSHYLPSSQKQNVVGEKSKVSISWNSLNSEIFTDDVDFKIYKTIHSISNSTVTPPPPVTTLVYHRKLLKDSDLSTVTPASNGISGSDISNLLVNQNPSDSTMTLLHFDVSSDTNISWEKIRWKPSFTVMSVTDTTTVKALVQYNPYSERLINTLPKNFEKYRREKFCEVKDGCPRCGTTSYAFPDFNGNSTQTSYTIGLSQPHSTTVTFSLKIKDSSGKVYTAKNTVNVVNNVMAIPRIELCAFFATIPILYEDLCLLPFYFEISSPDYEVAKKLASANPFIINSLFIGDPLMANTGLKADYFAYRSNNTHYNINTGLVYQGWGGFTYNGSKYPNAAIRENEFTTNPLGNIPAPGGASPCNPSAPDYFTCMTNFIMQQNNNRYFTPLQLDAEKDAYVSPLEPTELSEYDLQPYLLGVSATSSTIITTPVYAVSNPRGIILRSTSDSFHAYGAGSITPWLGISGHAGISTEKTSDYFQDFNGDHYPDIISGSYYQKTNTLGQLDAVSSISKKEIRNKGTVVGAGLSASASVAKFSNTANSFFAIGGEKDTHTGSSSFSLGIGVNVSIGKAWAQGTGVWADVNGDGLTDYISDGSTHINTGNGFVLNPYGWDVSEVSAGDSFAVSGGGGFSMANGSWAGGVGLSKSKSTAKTGLIDLNGDGLADKIIKNGNTYDFLINSGTSFIPTVGVNENFSLDNKQNSSGLNFYGTLCACFGLKICVSAGGSTDKSVSKQEVDLRDFDGDGYPDLLVSEDDTKLTYYHNNLPKANLLLTIENPLQGLIQMDYNNQNVKDNLGTLIGGTYQMPFSKTVLTGLAVWNFRPIDTTLPFLGPVLDPQKIKPAQFFRFEYEKGIQDRREREFLGFGIVKTKVYNDQLLHQTYVTQYETDYTGSESNFYVNYNDTKVRQYFYKKGLIRTSYMLDSQNRKRTETKYTYRYFDQPSTTLYSLVESQTQPVYKDIGRIISLLHKTESTFTEFSGSNSHSKTTIKTIDAYDKYGNVVTSTDRGPSLTYLPDDIKMQISYHAPGVKNIVGIPAEQTVIAVANNEVMRKSTTILDAAQNIKQIKKDILGTGNGFSGTADFDMEYDVYGNMTKLTQPVSANLQRMFFNFTYDPVYHTYMIGTQDAHGFTSTVQYDNNYLLGVPVTVTDINGATVQYTYDSFGRITQYLAPSDTDWTIKMYYYPSQTIPVAITERKEAGFSLGYSQPGTNYFTSLFTDAWGEGIMSKKLFKKENQTYYFANNIYQIKDKLGRPVKTILRDKVTTGTDIMTSLQIFDDYTTAEEQSAQIYSTIAYDDLDRPVTTTQHNVTTNNGLQNLTTNIFYEFGTDRHGGTQFATRLVSPLGNTTVTYTDEFGRTTSTKQINGNDNLWVGYRYNRLNELTALQDAGNNTTEYSYDKFGRNITKIEPDAGVSGFEYDLSGKLVRSYNAQLQANGKKVQYRYNFNQLTEIEYPDHTVTYEYGGQGGINEEKGRLIKQTDRTGTQAFKYDLLGNVRENMRIVVAPHNVPKMFKTSFVYDVYGRINKIFYPDTEEITYSYNMSGLLDNIKSKLPGKSKPTDIAYSMIYNNRDQITSYLAGNGTKTQYDYDPWGKIDELSLLYTSGNTSIRKNQYTFDGNGNAATIKGITPMTGNLPSTDMAIATDRTFTYDPFGRLNSAQITATGTDITKYYNLSMNYNAAGNMTVKNSRLKTYLSNGSCQYPDNEGDVGTYEYGNPDHPNAVSAIHYVKFANFNAPMDCGPAPVDPAINARESFEYDLNGNLRSIIEEDDNGSANFRDLFWDDQNRLKAVVTQRENLNYYAYDAAGERILKNDAVSKSLYVNGNDPNSTTQMGPFTYYPNGYLVLNDKTMSSHYYMGSQKIATRVSKIPGHRFKIDLSGEYDGLALALGNEITSIIEEAGLHQQVWVDNEDSQGTYSPPTSSTQDDTLCPFLMEQMMYTFQQDHNDDCYTKLAEYYQQGLNDGLFCEKWTMFLEDECMINYTPPELLESEMYWIHPDHLSGASILVDSQGEITNWYEYMPYGEMLMEKTTMNYDHPYKFNGKELDMATGYYYYGARYYDPKRSFWLSVDPLAEITLSPYAYVWNDPVNFADPTGLMGERKGGNDPCDPPGRRSFVIRAWNWLFGGKSQNRPIVGMPTSSREPDLPTFSQAPDKRMPSTIGSAIQNYRDSKPLPVYGATGASLLVKGMTDGALDFGNFVRNSFANKSDYSGLGPRMTKWDGNTMSATESQDAKFNALLFADGLATAGLSSELSAVSETGLLKNTLPKSTGGKLLGIIRNGEIIMEGNTVASGKFDFVVMKNKDILLGRKHTFLSDGADVLAAGELKIRDGKIVGLNNLSGHYMPGSDISAKYLNIFKRNGVDVSKTHVKIYNSQGQVIKHISPK